MVKKKIKLRSGDVFSIYLDNDQYAFGRAIKKVDIGFVIEVFNYFSTSPNEYSKAINSKRLFYPQIIDSHSIFWLRDEGGWDIQGHEPSSTGTDDIYYVFGAKGDQKLIDINGNEAPIDDEKATKYFRYSPKGDMQIKQLITFWTNKKN